MSEQQIELVEITIEQAKNKIAVMDAIDRLTRNRDFKKVFTEGYFEREPARLVKMKADPSSQTPEAQASILRQIDAIGTLHQYLRTQHVLGQMAQRDLAEHEQTLVDLRNSEGEEEEDEFLGEGV